MYENDPHLSLKAAAKSLKTNHTTHHTKVDRYGSSGDCSVGIKVAFSHAGHLQRAMPQVLALYKG